MNATIMPQQANPRFTIGWADTPELVEACQRLRYRVFAEEMGAEVSGGSGLDSDRYDRWCRHLLVRDRRTGRIIACSRILDDTIAGRAGGFYSEAEFDLAPVRRLPGRIMELGRTCVAAEYRQGATIAALWSGLAGHIVATGYDYLIGCASIPAADGGLATEAIMARLRKRYLAQPGLRLQPRRPMPALPTAHPIPVSPRMPPLLKAYLSLGARVCGEPCWDPEFRVADVFILVDTKALSERYVRRFVGVEGTAIPRAAGA